MKYFYDIIGFVGLLIWVGGTWYFGWNDKAITGVEKMTDAVGTILIGYGFLNSFVRGVKTEVVINNYK